MDFVHREDAQQALQLDGRKIFDSEIKVNWAVHARKDDSTSTVTPPSLSCVSTIQDWEES